VRKILLIHTKYQNIGGEDIAVDNEIDLLEKEYEIKSLILENSFKTFFLNLIGLNNNQKKINNLIEQHNPSIVYFQNTWFSIPSSYIRLLSKRNLDVRIKLHNFRYICCSSYLLKNHVSNMESCGACGIENKKYKFFNKYFEESYLKSIYSIYFHKKFFSLIKDANLKIYVLTNFHRNFLINKGINEEKISVLRNYLPEVKFGSVIKDDDYILYAGRISKEKGIIELLESFNKSNVQNLGLKIIGSGPLLDYVKKIYSSEKIKFYGALDNKEVLNYIKNAKAVVTATKMYEGQPNLLCESSLLGKVSIFPNAGGIKEFFPQDSSFMYDQFQYDQLVEKIISLKDNGNLDAEGIKNKKFANEILSIDKLIRKFKESK
jgi:glycosyltransferase involved in cell wall biosynthesis